MLRIKDPKASLDFFSRVLGMRLIRSMDFPEAKFSLYFMGYVDESQIPHDDTERNAWLFQQPATLELTYNYGTELLPDFKYNNGNVEPNRGFGHIGIDVPDVNQACARFEALGVKFIKKPNEGRMRNLAFIETPDGYWVEIFSHNQMVI